MSSAGGSLEFGDVDGQAGTPGDRVRELLERIAGAAGVEATIDVREDDETLYGEFQGSDLGLLIGHHALQLLSQDRHTQVDLHQSLRSLGYSETNIGVVEKSLLTFNFFHEEPAGGKKIEYEIHDDVVQEYLALRFEPAYIDNVAMVTPVARKSLPLMSKTRGDRAEDFPRRVATTLAFI